MEVRSELLVDERPGSWFIHLRLSAQLTCVKVFVMCARGFVVASVARLLISAARLRRRSDEHLDFGAACEF